MNKSARYKAAVLLISIGSILSCHASGADECAFSKDYVPGTLSGFAAGYEEETFQQMYDPRLSLPIGESDFLHILKNRHLNFEVYSKGSDAICRDWPQRKRVIDHGIVKIYAITDRSKLTPERGVHFAAYVNSHGQVVYVENRFEYEGP